MPANARCAIGCCDNDKRYPDLIVKRSHVDDLLFHKWPRKPDLAAIWRRQVRKTRRDDFNPKPGAQGTFVCSNHFPLGKRTPSNRETDFPSVFLTVSDYIHSKSPKKSKANKVEERRSSASTTTTTIIGTKRGHMHGSSTDESDPDFTIGVDTDSSDQSDDSKAPVVLSLRFEQFTRECDVKFYTGLPSTAIFKCLFDFLAQKAQRMQYWRGAKQTEKETPNPPTAFQIFAGSGERHGPPRKLRLEQEMLLTLMKLTDDLSFRFQVSSSTTSSIFVTWVKLMSKELSVLIIWPSRQQVKKTLPSCFKRLYPKVRCIIDCFECFTETPSGLDLAASLWSEYKHHYTFKALVAITPNGAISYVSPTYGGRATDIFIVKNSGFMSMLEPYDEVMADRGFKIREELMLVMATLCIPPSKAASMQMLPSDVRKTSNIANVRIYVEQAIGRMKVFHVLKHELPISLLPLANDIVRVCCALCNLLPPLCS